jgi:hypothetical protein
MSTLIVRLAVGLAAACMLVACGTSGGGTPPASTQPAGPSQAVGDAPADEEPTATPDPAASATGDLTDDEHPAYIKSIDANARTLTFDLVQWLTGDAATVAFQQANPGETGGPPNDYFIVNNNPRLRTYPVAPNAVLRTTPGGDPNDVEDIALADFASYQRRDALFWLTIKDGVITTIQQQWVP